MKKKKFPFLKIPPVAGVFIFLLILVSSVLYFRYNPLFLKIPLFWKPPPNLQSIAEKIVETCKDFKYRQGCYEKEIPSLMYAPELLTMQQSFEVTENVQKIDTDYGYCHVTGHNLSQQEVRKNPDDWKSVLTKCPVAGCANGCIHGVFMEKFNTDTFSDQQINFLSQDLKTVCMKNELWNPTSSETSGCFHALGHAAMYLTEANVKRSIQFCYKVADSIPALFYNCYQGVFMQIFQPLEAEDRLLVAKIKPKTQEEAVDFCYKYTGYQKITCLNQMWPLFFKQFRDPEKLDIYCKYYDPKDKQRCYSTAINILTSNLKLDVNFMFNYCSQLTEPLPGECLGISASRMFEIDTKNKEKALTLCTKGSSVDPKGICFQRLISTSNNFFRDPQSEKPEFCKDLPEEWKRICLGN
ncbi:MAG: hypothetical protein ACD_30C00042G0016 [uncultured bacterium]|uniref:Uncharacterized protein n=4 Tax=Candidatus Daviesiibacteriota TaxID=1752718 RepID=A0A0G0ELN1_9BACT|nr:MAG: hypothetical protein ACD_30C00042G0016 [uncultured bacterium]KKQ07968.1 MAG: hypothetical protein US19_C0034G0004 [Candidatus Daviesbacteria bacterium GW2011_GWB1_36_5]KKQ16090.1 MAG: hypothetical protein US28_C0005G0005 [Candidatus Daviesbacteria bacterium GW2011_GWA1_36_8]